MAKLERRLRGNFDGILDSIEQGVLRGSISAHLEDGADWQMGEARSAVRVFERYSWLGGNRVSLNLTMLGVGDEINITAITAGGSQAVFFKINTFGEHSFLNTLENVLNEYEEYGG